MRRSPASKAAKMKQLREQGHAARYHGQIGRAQTHYTVEDYPLMQQVFEESLWPILQDTRTATFLALLQLMRCKPHVHRRNCARKASAWAQCRPHRSRPRCSTNRVSTSSFRFGAGSYEAGTRRSIVGQRCGSVRNYARTDAIGVARAAAAAAAAVAFPPCV